MKITLLPSSVCDADKAQTQFLSSYLINETVCIDAGSVGFFGSPEDQARIKHIFISHTHIDHLASLPIFLENAFGGDSGPVTIHGSDTVLDCLRRDLFNDRLWPDFVTLSEGDTKFLQLRTLEPETPVSLGNLRITPVPVNHVVPTVGFIVEDNDGAVVITSDTGPTDALWEKANQTPNLKAVFLEVTFPNELVWLADAAKHLTPTTFAGEVRKIKTAKNRPAILAVHLKPRFRDQILGELKMLQLPNLEIARFGTAYDF